MTIAFFTLTTWLVVIIFAIIPKRFTLTEMIFLYFVISIMTITAWTNLDVNLQWTPCTRNVEKAMALNINRIVEIPLLFIMSSEVLNSSIRRTWRWAIALAINLYFTLNYWLLVQFGCCVNRQWNDAMTFFTYGMFIVLFAWIARWFVRLDKRRPDKLERDRL